MNSWDYRNDNNPYRRYCGKCGQQQDQYQIAGHSHTTWWSAMAPIKNENCDCHKDTKQ